MPPAWRKAVYADSGLPRGAVDRDACVVCVPEQVAIVLWTTRYIDAAVVQLQAEGHELREEDVARLSRSSTAT